MECTVYCWSWSLEKRVYMGDFESVEEAAEYIRKADDTGSLRIEDCEIRIDGIEVK